MSSSKYQSQNGAANLARLFQIILGPCTDILRSILTKLVNPYDLRRKFYIRLAQKMNLKVSKKQKQLVDGGKYSDFDISLLYILLRNISGIPPHQNNWNNRPSPTDRSVSANVERIRMLRNDYFAHTTKCFLLDSEFEQIWKEVFQTVQELEQYVGTSTVHQDAVTKLKNRHIEYNEVTKLFKAVENLKDKVDVLEKEIVPWNVQDIYEKNITAWRGDDNLYIETHTFDKMLEKVLSQPFMTFVGASGSGKTATVRHIALQLQEEGYEILPITAIGDLETYCDPYNPQVFIIDNALGSFGLDMSAFCMLKNFFENSEYPPMPRTKVLMTCREVVFKNKKISISVLSNKANVIFLTGEEHMLNVHDKHKILSIYKLETNMLTTGDLASSSNMFPLLCKLFSTKDCFKIYGPSFFITPIPIILKELEEMSVVHETRYASLVLLMANQNRLSKDILDNTKSDENSNFSNELKFQILAACKVKRRTDSFRFIDALLQMVGTYTKICESEFTFIHESLFEIVAYHFGSQNPNLMLQCMDSNFIANNIKLEPCYDGRDWGVGNENPIDLRIKVCNFEMLAERLYSDVRRGELYNVFGNKALKHRSVLEAFIGLMEKESDEKLHSVFLSGLQTNIVKHIYAIIKKDNRLDLSVNFEINFLLVGLGRFFDGSVRAISWVVYYGHYQILQCIMYKMNYKRDSLFSGTFKKTEKRHSDRKLNDTVTRDLDKATIEQYRLLCLACHSGNLDTVMILLNYVVDKRIVNGEIGCHKIPGMEPLVIACFRGYISIAMELLDAGASVNLKSCYWTPLAAASYKGHLCLVEELIKAGADVNIGLSYKSPIELARLAKHTDIVDELEAADSNTFEQCFSSLSYHSRCISVSSQRYNRGYDDRYTCSDPVDRITFMRPSLY